MKKNEAFLQNQLEFFQEKFTHLLDFNQCFGNVGKDINEIGVEIRTQGNQLKELREQVKVIQNNRLETLTVMDTLKTNGTQTFELVERQQSELEEKLEHLQKLETIEKQLQEVIMKFAENKREMHQMMQEFIGKITSLVSETNLVTTARKEKVFF